MLTVSGLGAELTDLADLADSSSAGERRLVGLAGAPGSGKTRLSVALVQLLGDTAAHVPMDGFHLADVQLAGRGLLDRKGAPETFDAWGYAALLRRLRERPSYTVYAPGFERDLEQPIAGAIAVEPEADLVVTEGNYLLIDEPQWRDVRAQLDTVWYVLTEEPLRRERLLARHVGFGKSMDEAVAWIQRVDAPNARLVQATRARADLVIDLSAWNGRAPTG